MSRLRPANGQYRHGHDRSRRFRCGHPRVPGHATVATRLALGCAFRLRGAHTLFGAPIGASVHHPAHGRACLCWPHLQFPARCREIPDGGAYPARQHAFHLGPPSPGQRRNTEFQVNRTLSRERGQASCGLSVAPTAQHLVRAGPVPERILFWGLSLGDGHAFQSSGRTLPHSIPRQGFLWYKDIVWNDAAAQAWQAAEVDLPTREVDVHEHHTISQASFTSWMSAAEAEQTAGEQGWQIGQTLREHLMAQHEGELALWHSMLRNVAEVRDQPIMRGAQTISTADVAKVLLAKELAGFHEELDVELSATQIAQLPASEWPDVLCSLVLEIASIKETAAKDVQIVELAATEDLPAEGDEADRSEAVDKLVQGAVETAAKDRDFAAGLPPRFVLDDHMLHFPAGAHGQSDTGTRTD